MDTDLSKTLEQLRAKKKSINIDANLTRECGSIIELNDRLSLLLNEVQSLHKSVQEQSEFVADSCDALKPSHKILKRSCELFEFLAQLTKLNRLCKRIDKIQAFECHQQHLGFHNIKSSPDEDVVGSAQSENDVEGCDDELTSQILEISRQFELVYKPLEELLSKRQDLPYVSYANKVRNLITATQTVSSNDKQDIKQ